MQTSKADQGDFKAREKQIVSCNRRATVGASNMRKKATDRTFVSSIIIYNFHVMIECPQQIHQSSSPCQQASGVTAVPKLNCVASLRQPFPFSRAPATPRCVLKFDGRLWRWWCCQECDQGRRWRYVRWLNVGLGARLSMPLTPLALCFAQRHGGSNCERTLLWHC